MLVVVVATNSCRGASDNGSAAAASVALRMMWMRVASRAAACLLEWGAELDRQYHLAAGSSDLCSSRVHVQGDPGRSACPRSTPTETRAMQVSGKSVVAYSSRHNSVQHDQCDRHSPTWRQPNCAPTRCPSFHRSMNYCTCSVTKKNKRAVSPCHGSYELQITSSQASP